MKWYRGRDGNERLWLERDEIESMMEDELRKAKLFPPQEDPVVDIERFIERHLRVQMDQHADLEPIVLGVTEFYTDFPPKIFINRDLTGAVDDDETPPGVLGRWRATLAHEASHVVLHRVLFELQGNQGGLFHVDATSEEQIQRLMRCLKSNVLFRNGGSDWREVQANLGMAALLMPRSLFSTVANEESYRLGFQSEAVIPGSFEAEMLAARMSTLFSVSRQAALIRLETLGLLASASQQRLI
jgi:hypothetical protein